MSGRWPSRWRAGAELLAGSAILAAGLAGAIRFSAVPWLLLAATLGLWYRGPSWSELGLGRPTWRAVAVGAAVGFGYQMVGTFVIEPLVARLTTGTLPDLSMVRPLVGDGRQLAIFLALAWTVAAFMEEMVFRGWLMFRVAELGRFSSAAWVAAVIVSSAVFGLAHLYQGLSGVIAAGLSGVVFGTLYLGSGRDLWPPIVAHGVLDTVAFVMIYFGVYPGL